MTSRLLLGQTAALGFRSLLRFSILHATNGQKRNSNDTLQWIKIRLLLLNLSQAVLPDERDTGLCASLHFARRIFIIVLCICTLHRVWGLHSRSVYCITIVVWSLYSVLGSLGHSGSLRFPWGSVWLTRWGSNCGSAKSTVTLEQNKLIFTSSWKPIDPFDYPFSRCPKFQSAQPPRTTKRGKPPTAWIRLLRVILF